MSEHLERLQKFMAHAGIGSRRYCEKLISGAHVKINNKTVIELGTQIDPDSDCVTVDGVEVQRKEETLTLIMNKPIGVLTTVNDPQGRPTVMEYLPERFSQRLYPVGRLDKNTTGLLLFTNDGELANRIMHPKHELIKWYQAKVKGTPSKRDMRALEEGIDIGGFVTSPAKARVLEKQEGCTVVLLGIHEGRNRQVRRMFGAIQHPVMDLKRVILGPLELGNLEPGECRPLSKRELSALKKALQL